MHQPFRGEILRGADCEHAGTVPLHQPLRGGADVIERLADLDEIVAAGGRDLEALALAVEQPDAELRLQRLHLLADRALGDVKFLGGAREALVTGGGLERPEGIERRQPAWH